MSTDDIYYHLSFAAPRLVTESCIQGLSALVGGVGNIGASPEFKQPNNLRLKATSPCIDAGLNVVDVDPLVPGIQTLPALDLDGNPRIVDSDLLGGAAVDMGAYETQP